MTKSNCAKLVVINKFLLRLAGADGITKGYEVVPLARSDADLTEPPWSIQAFVVLTVVTLMVKINTEEVG